MRDLYSCILICIFLVWNSSGGWAWAWGPAAHAAIGQLVEEDLLRHDEGLMRLLARFRDASERPQVQRALLDLELPEPGAFLRTLSNWPDWYKRRPGMLTADDQRHYINLPVTTRYNRAQHCSDGLCSIETLLEQRAILADHRAPLSKRAVALAWVLHLVGDMHQPFHTGAAEDRGGNLVCVSWMDEPSRLITVDGKPGCSGSNLHAIWDSKLIAAATGFSKHEEGPGLAKSLRPFLARAKAVEPLLAVRTNAEWRVVVERWNAEAQALRAQEGIYPAQDTAHTPYVQRMYPLARTQLLRATVRMASMLHLSLKP